MFNLKDLKRNITINSSSVVSGAKFGSGKSFYCRDFGMKAHGSSDFARHFGSDSYWHKDVTYRVHIWLPILNRLMEPMTWSASQRADRVCRHLMV